MVKELVFLLEEPSMAEVLKVLIPKILSDDIGFKLIVHDGKQDLEKSIPIRLHQYDGIYHSFSQINAVTHSVPLFVFFN
jgi:hypothetical protein